MSDAGVARSRVWPKSVGSSDQALQKLRLGSAERLQGCTLGSVFAESSDTSGPFSFDRGSPFELKAELAKELNRRRKVIDDDSYVVHPFEGHGSNLQSVVYSDNGPRPRG